MSAPELDDAKSWSEATPEKRWEVVQEIASRSSRELRAFRGVGEPRRYRVAGPRLTHRRSGLRLCVVPGPAPFLLCEDVVTRADLARMPELAVADDRRVIMPDVDDDVMPAYLEPRALELLAPLRLPTDLEWEHAARAGTTTPFWWGDLVPSAPPSLPHPLGLVRLGWYDEATADGTVRGGAARHWPWRPEDERWRLLLSAASRPAGADEPLALRPALSIPGRALASAALS